MTWGCLLIWLDYIDTAQMLGKALLGKRRKEHTKTFFRRGEMLSYVAKRASTSPTLHHQGLFRIYHIQPPVHSLALQ
jgi:hypothetical protein